MFFFFFNDTATTEIYTLSLHDALPILFPEPSRRTRPFFFFSLGCAVAMDVGASAVQISENGALGLRDRKSTRLNSSHLVISYAVFCLKKKKNNLTVLTQIEIMTRIYNL